MDKLIDVLNPISIKLVQELDRIRKEINWIDESIFTDSFGKQVKDHWKDFQFTGLNNIDYITSDFYLGGFENEDDELLNT